MNSPRVSITMPVLNGERYIGRALESIAAQTYRDFELIVVDDGSTDRTAACVDAFRDRLRLKRVTHAWNQGIARSVNDGLRQSSGEFIAFLDHDDCWLPEFLETQVRYLDSHPEVGMAHSDYQITDGDDHIVCESVARWRGKTCPSGNVFADLLQESFIVGNSVLIRKPCIARFGGFSEDLPFGDYHLWMRIARHYQIGYVPKPLTQYRQHISQTIRNVSATRPEDCAAVRVIKSILEEYPEAWAEVGNAKIRHRFASLYFDVAYSSFLAGASKNARACLHKAIPLGPGNLRYYTLYAATLLPPAVGTGLRRGWRSLRRAASTSRSSSRVRTDDAATEVWR
jgi:glycosyltransferase involved in cell wall biosynthesis